MKKNNKTAKQKRHDLHRYQAGALLVLCSALIYYIVAQGAMVHSQYYPTVIFAPVASDTYHKANSNEKTDDTNSQSFPTEFGEISMGTELNDQHRIDNETSSFQSKTEKIYLSVELINPKRNDEIQGSFYYYGNKNEKQPMLLSSSSATLVNKSQDVVYFSLARPGTEWQLKGKFMARVEIMSSGEKEEAEFTIY